MKKWFRSRKSRALKASEEQQRAREAHNPSFRSDKNAQLWGSREAGPAADYISRLSPDLLERVFRLVCPHSCDDTYEACEDSAVEDACMLCDQRDLAHCARVSRAWRKTAVGVL